MLDKYPNILYTNNNIKYERMKDIFHKCDFVYYNMNYKKKYFKKHIIRDNETPESISFDYYETSKYYFLILLINEKYDPYFDWVLTQEELKVYATKIVTENPDEVRDFFLKNSSKYDELSEEINDKWGGYYPPNPTDVTDSTIDKVISLYYNILNEENDTRRIIYLPNSDLMDRTYINFMEIVKSYD